MWLRLGHYSTVEVSTLPTTLGVFVLAELSEHRLISLELGVMWTSFLLLWWLVYKLD